MTFFLFLQSILKLFNSRLLSVSSVSDAAGCRIFAILCGRKSSVHAERSMGVQCAALLYMFKSARCDLNYGTHDEDFQGHAVMKCQLLIILNAGYCILHPLSWQNWPPRKTQTQQMWCQSAKLPPCRWYCKKWTPFDTSTLHDGVKASPNGFLPQCLFFYESLMHPKLCPEIKVRWMMRSLMRPARELADYLADIENPCMKDPGDAKTGFCEMRSKHKTLEFWGGGAVHLGEWPGEAGVGEHVPDGTNDTGFQFSVSSLFMICVFPASPWSV